MKASRVCVWLTLALGVILLITGIALLVQGEHSDSDSSPAAIPLTVLGAVMSLISICMIWGGSTAGSDRPVDPETAARVRAQGDAALAGGAAMQQQQAQWNQWQMQQNQQQQYWANNTS